MNTIPVKSLSVAQEVLSRWNPPMVEEVKLLVRECQAVVADALAKGDVRTTRWLIETVAKHLPHRHEGLVGQLVGLLAYVDHGLIRREPAIALKALPVARDLELMKLLESAAIGTRAAVRPPLRVIDPTESMAGIRS